MAEEQDEVAAYLARERAALGEDADLFAGDSSPTTKDEGEKSKAGNGSGIDAFPDLDNLNDTPTPGAPDSQESPSASEPKGIDAFPDLLAANATGYDVRVTGVAGTGLDPEREAFESSFPDIESEMPALEPHAIPYGTTPYPAQPYSSANQTDGNGNSSYTSILPPPAFASSAAVTDEETEPILEWKARQAEEIKKRDEASKAKREETILKAEKAIDAFYDKYNAEKEKTIKENKEKEAKFVAELQESVAKGTSWERITDILELQNSQSKTIRPSAPGGSDLQRMKEILLSLRREGDRAPAAGGY